MHNIGSRPSHAHEAHNVPAQRSTSPQRRPAHPPTATPRAPSPACPASRTAAHAARALFRSRLLCASFEGGICLSPPPRAAATSAQWESQLGRDCRHALVGLCRRVEQIGGLAAERVAALDDDAPALADRSAARLVKPLRRAEQTKGEITTWIRGPRQGGRGGRGAKVPAKRASHRPGRSRTSPRSPCRQARGAGPASARPLAA